MTRGDLQAAAAQQLGGSSSSSSFVAAGAPDVPVIKGPTAEKRVKREIRKERAMAE